MGTKIRWITLALVAVSAVALMALAWWTMINVLNNQCDTGELAGNGWCTATSFVATGVISAVVATAIASFLFVLIPAWLAPVRRSLVGGRFFLAAMVLGVLWAAPRVVGSPSTTSDWIVSAAGWVVVVIGALAARVLVAGLADRIKPPFNRFRRKSRVRPLPSIGSGSP